jgi:hypothetical protein
MGLDTQFIFRGVYIWNGQIIIVSKYCGLIHRGLILGEGVMYYLTFHISQLNHTIQDNIIILYKYIHASRKYCNSEILSRRLYSV